MFRTAAQALAELDAFFATHTAESQKLWDILAGTVRGPDVNSDSKEATITLRGIAFPNSGYGAGSRDPEQANRYAKYADSSHWKNHIALAVSALQSIFPRAVAPAPAAESRVYDPSQFTYL